MARGNRTMDNLENEKKGEVMCVPPTTMEEAHKGLYTYLHFLSMAGFVNNAHYEGVMKVRRVLNELSTKTLKGGAHKLAHDEPQTICGAHAV